MTILLNLQFFYTKDWSHKDGNVPSFARYFSKPTKICHVIPKLKKKKKSPIKNASFFIGSITLKISLTMLFGKSTTNIAPLFLINPPMTVDLE